MKTPRCFAWILGIVALLQPGPSGAEEGATPRSDLEAMEAILDKVVGRVSEPSAAPFLGASEASHAYRLAGYGALFVVAPRVLPHPGKVVIVRKEGSRDSVTAWSDDEAPEMGGGDAMERTLSELRTEQRRIQKEMEAQGRSRVREAREKELRAIEEKVEALQRAAQRTRQDAERALEMAVREVQIQLGPPEGQGPVVAVAPMAPPSPPSPPAPPAPVALPAPLAPPPPWRFWIESEEREDPRAPERVVADVKGAVAQAIESHGARLRSVRPEEFIAVAVDFVSPWGWGDRARAERTLIVRVRKKDLDEWQARKISSEELRKRFEFVEY